MEQRFEIGTIYKPYNQKAPKITTIVDVYKTYNSNKELVKISYVTEHEFMGQKIKRYDVSDTEIARSGITPRNGVQLSKEYQLFLIGEN